MSNTKKKLPSDEIISKLLSEGKTPLQIAEMYKVHPSGIYRSLDRISEKENKPRDSYLSQPQKSHPGAKTPSVTIKTAKDSCEAKVIKKLYVDLYASMKEFITTRKGD